MKKPWIVGLSMMLLLSALVGFADKHDTEDKIFPYAYQIKDFDNGLRVIVVPTDYPNIVSLQIPVQVGSRNEVEKGKSGFAHFFEHMMFRGTEQYSPEAYTQILKNAGVDSNAYTSDDLTNYHMTFSKEDLETMLMLEADRFQNLKYSEDDFKTEAQAVLGEYNKNFSDPTDKLFEVQRNAAFSDHPYKHTTMGFIEDIMSMPGQFEFSRGFFDKFYRPERTILILSGDVDPQQVFGLVEKYWGAWKAGSFVDDIPAEPEPQAAVYAHVDWESSTLPWVTVAFHGPAFSDEKNDMAAMDIVSQIAFSSSSPLYQKLVVDEQKVDELWSHFPDHKDPHLLTVAARVKNPADVWKVREEILEAFAKFRTERVSTRKLEDIKSNLKYAFANQLDNSEAIAEALVGYVARTRDPETLNKLYRHYGTVTPEDIKRHAESYFTDKRLVVVTLSHDALPEMESKTGSIDAIVEAGSVPPPDIASVLHQNASPLINFRILFNVGAALDPAGKSGLAQLTAAMITDAGSQSMRYEDIQRAFYPMAATFGNQVDKEMTVFTGTIHRDLLNEYYEIVSGQLLTPAWSEADFNRVKTTLINAVKFNLRENNDEELGKEALYEFIYQGHPYGHLSMGHADHLAALTLEDVKNFFKAHYNRANLVLGLSGGFTTEFLTRVKRDLGKLPEGEVSSLALKTPQTIEGLEAQIIQKNSRAVAVSFGFPIDVTRTHEDFSALWLIRSYFGEHRSFNGVLMNRIRGIRGLNYGDYAYIEYFPRGMFQFHPDANLGRSQQIFQVWIRPVVNNNNAHFATRVAMYELSKLLREGMPQAGFEATQNYLLKFIHLLTKTQDKQLGYALDSRYYGIDEFTAEMSAKLNALTLDKVNAVIKKHVQDKNIKFVFITNDAQDMRARLLNNTPSPMTYPSAVPPEVTAEDKVIESWPLVFKEEKVKVTPVEAVFDTP